MTSQPETESGGDLVEWTNAMIEEAFDDAAEARDGAGFVGTPAECIRFLDAEVLALKDRLQAAEARISALLGAAKGLSFGAYPAHGSGFVCVVEGDLDAFRDAIAEADQFVPAPPASVVSGEG